MKRLLLLAAFVAGLAACQEQLASPVECPAQCPGGSADVIDLVIEADAGRDSTFDGYVPAVAGGSMLVSTGVPEFDARGVIRFGQRIDSFSLNGGRQGYTIDSIAFNLVLLERDSTAAGQEVLLYRLPRQTDTTLTYDEIVAATAGVPAVRLPMADTLRSGPLRVVLTGAALDPLVIAPEDSGFTAFAVALSSPQPAGIRLATVLSQANNTSFVTYADVIGVDSTLRKQTLTVTPELAFYVPGPRAAAPSGALLVGGEPSSRSILRFTLPAVVRDSAAIVRATLELLPEEAVRSVPVLPTTLQARAVQSDLGAKSPLDGNPVSVVLRAGASDTVRLEVAPFFPAWQGPTGRPATIFLQTNPEGASWARFAFGSSAGTRRPRLRITYLRSFPFEAP